MKSKLFTCLTMIVCAVVLLAACSNFSASTMQGNLSIPAESEIVNDDTPTPTIVPPTDNKEDSLESNQTNAPIKNDSESNENNQTDASTDSKVEMPENDRIDAPANNGADAPENNNPDIPADNEAEDTEGNQFDATTDNEVDAPDDTIEYPSTGETPNVTIETYSEYLSYLSASKLPEEFVTYSSISQFGTFKRFVCLSDSRYGDYSHYMYKLVDETGTEVTLYIECGRQSVTTTQLPLIASVNTQDMRRLSTTEKGRYLHGGVEYTYLSGKLYSIAWEDGGRTFKLACDSMFSSYPEGVNTAIELLMDVNNAAEVTTSISKTIEKE